MEAFKREREGIDVELSTNDTFRICGNDKTRFSTIKPNSEIMKGKLLWSLS
jgi:hypothetical protein